MFNHCILMQWSLHNSVAKNDLLLEVIIKSGYLRKVMIRRCAGSFWVVGKILFFLHGWFH